MELDSSECPDSDVRSSRVLTRRRLLVSATAAAPILVLATPAPAFALTACGNVAFPGAWAWTSTGLTAGGNFSYLSSPGYFESSKDPVLQTYSDPNNGSIFPYTAKLELTGVPVTVGKLYTFNFTVDYNHNYIASPPPPVLASFGQQFTLTIGTSTMTRSTQLPGTLIGAAETPTRYPLSLAFTPTTPTVTITFVFAFSVDLAHAPPRGWDDIRIRNLMLRC